MRNKRMIASVSMLVIAAALIACEFIFHGGLLLIIGIGCAAAGVAMLIFKKHTVPAVIVCIIVYLLILTELLTRARVLFSLLISAVLIIAVVCGIKYIEKRKKGTAGEK